MYRYVGNIATADAAFEAEANNLAGLFQEAGRALFGVMVDLSAIQPVSHKAIQLSADSADKLLFDWLSELVYLKDKDYCLFSEFNVVITQNKQYGLTAEARGEKINPEKHKLKVDVKAVTYHMFYLKQEDGLWKARVVLDI